MRVIFTTSLMAVALAVAGPVQAKSVSLSVSIKSYRGNPAYVAAYIVGPKGEYVSTVYAAGSRSNYLADLTRWYRMMKRSGRGIDGATGASVGSGSGFRTTVNIPDKMFDAGYTLRIESAVEDQKYVPNDAAIKLDLASNGKASAGVGYVKSLSIKF